MVVHAVVAAEDKRFFQHSGFDPIRVLKAAYVNVKEQRTSQGASTLSMQLAGDFWLDRSERTWKRKAGEVLITLHLERKLTKEQIFEFYANQIYLGNVGSFSIHGFGQGAQTYFSKDIRHLTFLKRRSWPVCHKAAISTTRFAIPPGQKHAAIGCLARCGRSATSPAPNTRLPSRRLSVKMGGMDGGDAPYFVDLTYNWLRQPYPALDFQSQGYRIYTTLDMNLQREAVEVHAHRTG